MSKGSGSVKIPIGSQPGWLGGIAGGKWAVRAALEFERRAPILSDSSTALILVCTRLRHVAGTQWSNKKHMNMKHLKAAIGDASIAG